MRSGYRPPSLQRIGNSSNSTGKDILDKKFTITLTFELVFKSLVVILAHELYFHSICSSLHNLRTRLKVERSVRCWTMRAVTFEESSDYCQFAPHCCDHCQFACLCWTYRWPLLTLVTFCLFLQNKTALWWGDHCQSVLLRSIITWGFSKLWWLNWKGYRIAQLVRAVR